MIKLLEIIDEVEEYDVENEQDIREFIEFMEAYQNELNEADCDCMLEAKYQGRTVPLGKPMRGDSKKFKVYVKNPKTGKVVKVNFGAKGMNIKKNNPKRRAAFRARHNCANPGPRTKAKTKTISFNLPATDKSEFDESEDPMTEAFNASENNTLDNLLKPEVKKQGILDGYDWYQHPDKTIGVEGRFYIDTVEANITKDGELWGEFPLEDDWSDESTQEEYDMSRGDWKFFADQLGIRYPATLSTKLIAKRCQEFCLIVVEEYLS